jgi:hypothetical protein
VSNLTSEIAELYHRLVPEREEGLMLFHLHEKIRNGEIDANFSSQDIQRAIEETHWFSLGPLPNRERLLQNLLTYFIEHPAEQKNRYMLTEYARKFILLLEHKINNPFRKFPLRESFKRYADFSAADIRHINQLESWFSQGFQATTRENIFDHLEELKADVNESVQRLNKLLYSPDMTGRQMVADFSVIFTDLGAKADEIRDTLRLGNTLQLEVEQVVSAFYEQTQEFRHPSTADETAAFEQLLLAYSRASDIAREIQDFFEAVDGKLGQLRERIQYASTKLNELQDIFRYRSQFKINLKRLLEITLTAAVPEKNELNLPLYFSRRGLPVERFRLTAMPDLEREYADRNLVIETPEDPDYHRLEVAKVEQDLFRQQRTAVLLAEYKQRLQEEGGLDFTREFYHILDQEQDEEVAIQVGHELIQYAHDHPQYQVDILPDISDLYKTKPIITWTINLKRRN